MSENLTPRLYQLEIVELAKKSNVVAYLDTGAGKTFISILLLRHRQEAAAAANAAALAATTPPPPPWKAIFLAPQVALVEQQSSVLSRHLSARVRKLVGADIESWSGDSYISNWRQTLTDIDVLVATPQLVVDMLRHAVVPGLWVFDTIVFDEAHHCKGGHPYNRIMEYYKYPCPAHASNPRIFGMSAAPAGAGAAKSHMLPKSLALLELNMHSQVVTVADRSMVNAVVPQPDLEIEEYQAGEIMIEGIPKLIALREGIQKALARLDIAVALEQLRWTASLQGTVGLTGASDGTYCTFEPGAPRFKISKVKDILRNILHVLHQVGAYGAVRSTLHAFQWLAKGAPDARQDTFFSSSPMSYFNSNTRTATPPAGTRAAARRGRDEGSLLLDDLGFGEDTTSTPLFIATDVEYKFAELRRKAAEEGVALSEAENLGNAAVLSTVEVLKSFLVAFGEVLVDQNVVYALGRLEAAYNDIKLGSSGGGNSLPVQRNNNNNDLQTPTTKSAGNKRRPFSLSLGNVPIFIMQRILDLITPDDLEQSLDFMLSSTGRSLTFFRAPGAARACYLLRFEFPLLSPKTVKLVEILQRYNPSQSITASASAPAANQSPYWSGIVFVQQRTAVLALSSLLAHLPRTRSWLKTSPFMAQGAALGGCAFMPDEQKDILDSFRAGKLNLLVSTSVAEEGIDVKSCQLVIRFDPAPTAQAFHQSRGRARAVGSQLIALVEHGNEEEHAAVHEMAAYQHKMRDAALQNVAELAQAENINLDEEDEDQDDEMLENDDLDNNKTAYKVLSTGAKVDLHSAGSVLQHYISQLPADEYMLLRPAWRLDYIENQHRTTGTGSVNAVGDNLYSASGALFGGPPAAGSYHIRATVRLPSSSPLQTVTGQLSVTKKLAKASAALEACRQLHGLGVLNDHLLPAGMGSVANDDEDVDILLGGDKGAPGVETLIGKKRRAGTVFASITFKSIPPVGLSTPMPRGINKPGAKTVTLYGYGWKERHQQGVFPTSKCTWFPFVLLLPKFTDLSCCSSKDGTGNNSGNSSGGGGDQQTMARQWRYAVHLGKFKINEAQLQLVLQCDDALKTASGPWHSLFLSMSSTTTTTTTGAAAASGVDDNLNGSVNSLASTYALAPLLVESGNTSDTPRQLDWATLQRIIWLHDASQSKISVLDIMRKEEDDRTSTTSSRRAKQQNILQDSVLITKYNRMTYEFLNVSSTTKLSSKFPQDRNSRQNHSLTGGTTTMSKTSNQKNQRVDVGALLDDNATFSDFYARRWNENNLHQEQPLLQAARKRSSNLTASGQQSKEQKQFLSHIEGKKDKEDGEIEKETELVFLVPELCTLHPVPLSLWLPLAAVPKLLWDVHCSLHASELVNELQNAGFPAELCPPLYLIKQALTAPSAAIDSRDEGHYETLETLGDGLLKFATSTQLFLNNPVWHEGQLTAAKDRMVSNKKLIKVALHLGLEKRVRLSGWRSKERKNRKSNTTDEKKHHILEDGFGDIEMTGVEREKEHEEGHLHNGDAPDAAKERIENDPEEEEGRSIKRNGKLLADAMEALIGAFYIGGGIKAGLAFLQHVQLADCPLEKLALYCGKKTAAAAAPGCNGNNNNTSQKMDAFFSSYLSSSSSILHSLDIHQVETALGGYKFHNPAFAQEALTHGSVLGARCYQRLEFLGDCILDLIVVHKAYHAYKGDISPAQLHDVRSITLNAERLALSAVRANLHTHILYHSAALFNRIDDFVVEAEAVVKRVGKEAAGGVDFRSRSSSSESAWDDVMVRYAFGLDRTCAPKVLSDITEALLGAVWLDSQGDWEVAAGVALHLLSPLPWIDGKVIMDRRQQLPIPPHPVRRLHELAAKVGVRVDFQVVQDNSNSSDSINSVNTMAVRVMFGDRYLGQGPPSCGNKAAAARLAAQAVLNSKSEQDILSLFL